MSYPEDTINWQAIDIIDKWLDTSVSDHYKIQPLAQDWARISKVGEEVGEAIQAFVGYTGQNPRKGFTNDQEKVLDELADVVFTAILAIQHFTKDANVTRAILRSSLRNIYHRIKVIIMDTANE